MELGKIGFLSMQIMVIMAKLLSITGLNQSSKLVSILFSAAYTYTAPVSQRSIFLYLCKWAWLWRRSILYKTDDETETSWGCHSRLSRLSTIKARSPAGHPSDIFLEVSLKPQKRENRLKQVNWKGIPKVHWLWCWYREPAKADILGMCSFVFISIRNPVLNIQQKHDFGPFPAQFHPCLSV